MRAGRDGQVSYIVQRSFKVFGVKTWTNVQSFTDYNSAKSLYNTLLNNKKR